MKITILKNMEKKERKPRIFKPKLNINKNVSHQTAGYSRKQTLPPLNEEKEKIPHVCIFLEDKERILEDIEIVLNYNKNRFFTSKTKIKEVEKACEELSDLVACYDKRGFPSTKKDPIKTDSYFQNKRHFSFVHTPLKKNELQTLESARVWLTAEVEKDRSRRL